MVKIANTMFLQTLWQSSTVSKLFSNLPLSEIEFWTVLELYEIELWTILEFTEFESSYWVCQRGTG